MLRCFFLLRVIHLVIFGPGDEIEAKRLLRNFELVSMVHKQELAIAGKSERQRAHWVIQAKQAQP
jgi:hypothetical protein